eukprot:scaffold48554_cov48-Attheya_sp.AAC.1
MEGKRTAIMTTGNKPVIMVTSVLETRKIQNKGGTLQGGMNPTWLKQPNDKAVSLFGLGLCTYGVVNLIIGHYRLATGKGKLD